MRLTKRLTRKLLPVLLFAIAVAACSRGDDPPPAPDQKSDEVAVIVLPDAVASSSPDLNEDPGEVPSEEAARYVDEGLSKVPEADIAQNPRVDPSDAESPHPDRNTSSLGVGGSIGGGGGACGGGGGGGGYGGSSGAGGVAYRRARGGGGRSGGSEPQPREVRGNSDQPGGLVAQGKDGTLGAFPLKSTVVRARVTGSLAATKVTQTFTNPYTQAIEAVYTFPLPADSAVNDFVMTVGKRRIIGIVRPRAEAEAAYKEARARGYTASLMTQERPNIFTQNVANIAVNAEVSVTFTFFEMLSYRHGQFEYVFPLTIGPRYIPPAAATASNSSDPVGMEGTKPGNQRVPDAPAVTPPTLLPNERSGMDVDIEVELAPGLPIDLTRLKSVAHEVSAEMTSDGRVITKLKHADRIANRDFVLRWGVIGEAPQAAVWTHRDAEGGYVNLQLQPQLDPADVDVTPREITFLLDVSGSMSGEPAAVSRKVIKRVLHGMRPDDRFNIVTFAGSSKALFEAPAENTPEHVAQAETFVDSASTGGGTRMLEGFQHALKLPRDNRYLGIYAFMTDGFIGNEAEIHRLCAEQAGGARSFAFGIGGSVNRHLCDGVAEHGNGKAIYCLPRDTAYAERASEEFFLAIDSPVLCDIEIDWGGLAVQDVAPAAPTDLFAGEPLTLCARTNATGKHTVTVRGRVGGRKVALPIEVDLAAASSNPAIAALWARRTVDGLSAQLLQDAENQDVIARITDLGVRYSIVTKYTAFLAVDESRVNSDGKPLRVMVPCEMPEGVTFEGQAEAPRAARIDKWGMTLAQVGSEVHVVGIDDGSPAARMGMVKGQRLLRVNGVEVTSLEQVERLLLQGGKNPTLETRVNDEGQTIDAEFTLPDPVAAPEAASGDTQPKAGKGE